MDKLTDLQIRHERENSALPDPTNKESWEESFEELSRRLHLKFHEISEVKADLLQQELDVSLVDEDLQVSLEELRTRLNEKAEEAKTIQSHINDLHVALARVNPQPASSPDPGSRSFDEQPSSFQYESGVNPLPISYRSSAYQMANSVSGDTSKTTSSLPMPKLHTTVAFNSATLPCATHHQSDQTTANGLECSLGHSHAQLDEMREKLRAATRLFSNEERKFNDLMGQMEEQYNAIVEAKDQKLSQCNSMLYDRKRRCEELESRNSELCTTQAGLEGQIAELKSVNVVEKERCTNLNNRLTTISSKLQMASDANIPSYDDSAMDIEDSVDELLSTFISSYENLQQEVRTINDVLEESRLLHEAEINKLKTQHSKELEDIMSNHKNKLTSLSTCASEREQNVFNICSATEITLEELQRDVVKLDKLNKSVMADNERLQTELDHRNLEWHAEQSRIDISRKNDLLKQQILASDNSSFEKMMKELRNKVYLCSTEKTNLENEVALLKEQNKIIKSENASLTDMLQCNESHIENLIVEHSTKISELYGQHLKKEKHLSDSFDAKVLQIRRDFATEGSAKLSDMETKNNGLREKLESSLQTNNQLESELQRLKSDLSDLNSKNGDLEGQLEYKETNIVAKDSEITRVYAQLNEQKKLLEVTNVVKSGLEVQVEAFTAEKADILHKLDDKDSLVGELKSQAHVVIGEMEMLRSKFDVLYSNNKTNIKLLDENKQEIMLLSQRCKQLVKKIKSKSDEKENMEKHNAVLQQELEQKNRDFTHMEKSLKSKISSLEMKLARLNDEKVSFQNAMLQESNKQERKISNVVDKLKYAEDELQLAKTKQNSKQVAEKKAMKTAINVQTELTSQRKAMDSLKQKLSWLQEACDLSEKARLSVEKKLTKSTGKLKSFKEENDALKTDHLRVSCLLKEKDKLLTVTESALQQATNKFFEMKSIIYKQCLPLGTSQMQFTETSKLPNSSLVENIYVKCFNQLEEILRDSKDVVSAESRPNKLESRFTRPILSVASQPNKLENRSSRHGNALRHLQAGVFNRSPLAAAPRKISNDQEILVDGNLKEKPNEQSQMQSEGFLEAVSDAHLFYLNHLGLFLADNNPR